MSKVKKNSDLMLMPVTPMLTLFLTFEQGLDAQSTFEPLNQGLMLN